MPIIKNIPKTIPTTIYLFILLLALLGFVSSPVALILGFVFSLFLSTPFQKYNKKLIHYLLKISIVGLGFGMQIQETLQTSKDGFTLTVLSILLTLFLGIFLTKLLKIDFKLGYLITSGTAICGGSAIAAVSSVIKAKSQQISIALGVVFLLNSIALFIFPTLGHWIGLSQEQFGMWSAVAIHDTSSVVGASLEYGDTALKIATTIKLSRTLWIIPLSILSMFVFKSKKEKIKIPYFIGLFVLAIFINSYANLPLLLTSNIVLIAKRLLVVTLFIIGTNISISDIKTTGIKPLILALTLWVSISIFTLLYILFFQGVSF